MRPISQELSDRLWEAAPRLFDDVDGFSMQRVCDEIGIPRATLYYYFAGKSDLATFFSKEVIRRAGEVATDAAVQRGTVAERLRASLLALYEIADVQPDVTEGLLRFIAEHGSFLPLTDELREIAFAPVRKLLMEGRDAGEFDFDDIEVALGTFFGALEVIAVMLLRNAGQLPPDAIAQSLDLLIRGLVRQ